MGAHRAFRGGRGRRWRGPAGLAVPLLLLLTSSALGSGVYRWVDQSGGVHFGDRPPRSDANAVEEVEVPRAPAASPDAAQRRERRDRLLRAYEHERGEARARAQAAASERAKHAADCARLGKALERANTARYLYRKGKGGEPDILSEEERAAYVRKLEGTARTLRCP